ncbi:hypothetical protein F5Y04DRAFT_50310 [Hypomontagnella monticulosa]|nr:hypothetical protein F5Y04DRAFT_50310 [Hypomontagnella monticulosa]
MLAAQSPQRTSANRNRPIKLRSACNQCCAAKVKCSGEKSGCDRCRNAGTQCIYQESRVGKVPGIRAKKRPSGQQNQTQRLQNLANVSEERYLSPPDDATEPNFQEEIHNGNTEWSITDWDIPPSDTITMTPPDNPSDLQVAQPNDFEAPANREIDISIDPSIQELLAPNPTLNSPTWQAEDISCTPQLQVSLGLRPRTEVDSQCCLECCQIINDLETYIMADLKVFKIILGIVQNATSKLAQLIRLQRGSRNLRCMMLFTTLMYQILELLEVGLCAIAADKDKPRTRILAGGTAFEYEGVSVDVEEQSVLRKQTLLKEVKQATEVLGMLTILATAGPNSEPGIGPVSAQGKAGGECQIDLECRFKDLALRCGGKR